MIRAIANRPKLFIVGYSVLALLLGALVFVLRGYEHILYLLAWPVILGAMIVPWRAYVVLLGVGVVVTLIVVSLTAPNPNQSLRTALVATLATTLIGESVYRVMRHHRTVARALQESEERFRCTFERAPAPMAVTEMEGRLKQFNQRLCDVLGYERAELNWRMMNEFAHPDDRDTRLHTALLHSSDREAAIEKRYVTKDGRVVPVLLKGTLMRNAADEPYEILVIFFDLTEQREAEAQRLELERTMLEVQRLESLGALAGGVAHDFNNLLASILGNTNLALLDTPRHSSVRACLEQIESAVHRAAELTRQMLAYAGRGRVTLESIDVKEVLNATRTLLHTITPSTVSIRHHFESESLMVRFDRSQLIQIIVALVSNAAEAIGDQTGQITITIGERTVDPTDLPLHTVGADMHAGRYAFIEVCDTGCGIDPQTMARLFEPFFTTKQGRRGLGLAATLGILHSYGGAIQVESAPGQGSVFRVFIPAEQPAVESLSSAPTLPPSLEPAQPDSQESRRIVLVVDDERSVRSVAARMVERLGYKTLQAPDGNTGVELFSAHADSIACVLLDVSMPVMSGAQVLQMIRAIRPDTPIILMSGYAGEELAERYGQLQPNGFLYKPFDTAELSACLDAVLLRG
ncbi:response regulator [Roseiflexus sp.]|uniref:hybrid sensor histidine kinase/response regulator n=1 Tax=Roseiflexus sp. TaxID=2562120 RepID=UPI00398B49C6